MTETSGTLVVKRSNKQKSEEFDERKLSSSIEQACRSVSLPDGIAHDTAKHVVQAVKLWARNKQVITSDDIRRVATKSLTVVSPEAGYLYKHHHQIL